MCTHLYECSVWRKRQSQTTVGVCRVHILHCIVAYDSIRFRPNRYINGNNVKIIMNVLLLLVLIHSYDLILDESYLNVCTLYNTKHHKIWAFWAMAYEWKKRNKSNAYGSTAAIEALGTQVKRRKKTASILYIHTQCLELIVKQQSTWCLLFIPKLTYVRMFQSMNNHFLLWSRMSDMLHEWNAHTHRSVE